jgi:hypothetical protein
MNQHHMARRLAIQLSRTRDSWFLLRMVRRRRQPSPLTHHQRVLPRNEPLHSAGFFHWPIVPSCSESFRIATNRSESVEVGHQSPMLLSSPWDTEPRPHDLAATARQVQYVF